jgi:hypothetical protein
VRLRLQQVTNATDPQAMTQALAQTVFQGKAVDLTETRDYGSLVAAGLGQEWSGFGQTVFVRPMEQAWQQVLRPQPKVSTPSGAARWWTTGTPPLADAIRLKTSAASVSCRCWRNTSTVIPGALPAFTNPS